jgi:hypothetical protein
VLFVVAPRIPTGNRILYKLPLFTYHAYNTTGGGSLYSSSTVSLLRPGGGIGGPVKGLPDPFDTSSPRQTFAHWDGPFIAWLEAQGFDCDFCTDLDLHHEVPSGRYRVLVTAGHDEYWSPQMRTHAATFRRSGGNIANFGANTCWWRVHVLENDKGLTCRKFPPGASSDCDPDSQVGCPDHWWEVEPENSLFGTSFRNGGGHWNGERASQGFVVTDEHHWIYVNTGLRRGDMFGHRGALVGYECDGVSHVIDDRGQPRPARDDGTPDDFSILGTAELPGDWEFAARESHIESPRAATLGLRSGSGGAVFAAATTDWPRLVISDPTVATVTRNVLSRLT